MDEKIFTSSETMKPRSESRSGKATENCRSRWSQDKRWRKEEWTTAVLEVRVRYGSSRYTMLYDQTKKPDNEFASSSMSEGDKKQTETITYVPPMVGSQSTQHLRRPSYKPSSIHHDSPRRCCGRRRCSSAESGSIGIITNLDWQRVGWTT